MVPNPRPAGRMRPPPPPGGGPAGWEIFKRRKDSTFLYLFKGRSINWVTLTVLSTCGQVIDIFTSRFRNSSRGQKPEFRLAYCIYSTVSMWETESKSAQWIGLMLCWSRTAAYTNKSLINGFFFFRRHKVDWADNFLGQDTKANNSHTKLLDIHMRLSIDCGYI